MLKEYVLGFWVKKPYETISYPDCSAGERKIIKSFSTMLNKDYTPKIICIDNIEMHVELSRHIALVEALKECFSDSQIFATTHSHRISRNFGQKKQLYDLRLISNPNIKAGRLELIDELVDCVSKLKSLTIEKQDIDSEIKIGKKLIEKCYDEKLSDKDVMTDTEEFFKRVVSLHMCDINEGMKIENKI